MADQQAQQRPIGWWLKEADAQIDAALDTALAGTVVDRRGWQVLTSLARGPMPLADLVTSLRAFDSPSSIQAVVDDLQARGWIEHRDEQVSLTPEGARQQAVLAPLVGAVRQQISDALDGDDYVVLVGLLARLVEAVRPR